MKIAEAMLCLDCDEISLKATHCPICLSRSVIDLAKWIMPLDQARLEAKTREGQDDILREITEMRDRISCMMLDLGEEPLGCGA